MGSKKPQQAQQQADVVTGAAQHGMQRITERPFERIATESAVDLRVSDGWLTAAPLQSLLMMAV